MSQTSPTNTETTAPWVQAVQLAYPSEHAYLCLEPLKLEHEAALIEAASDGALWNLRVTHVPRPQGMRAYIEHALTLQAAGTHQFWAVRAACPEFPQGRVVGSTSYHDMVPEIQRLEIGYTWYARSVQRSFVNTTCKLLLLQHGFETLGAKLIGFRTDNFNFTSQRAIERLGAKRDGVLRHHKARMDGTVRDTVMYSISAAEWQEVKAHLLHQLHKAHPISSSY